MAGGTSSKSRAYPASEMSKSTSTLNPRTRLAVVHHPSAAQTHRNALNKSQRAHLQQRLERLCRIGPPRVNCKLSLDWLHWPHTPRAEAVPYLGSGRSPICDRPRDCNTLLRASQALFLSESGAFRVNWGTAAVFGWDLDAMGMCWGVLPPELTPPYE